MIFIYEEDGVVKYGQLVGDVVDINKAIPDGVDYFIKNPEDLPTEPIESWYMEDGQIKIDQRRLVELNRQNMPALTPIEFDLKLAANGLYDAVQDLIKTNRTLSIAYNRATFFSRTDPFIDQARIALGLTDEQVDTMWLS